MIWTPAPGNVSYENIPIDRQTVHSLVQFILNKFFTPSKAKKIRIEMAFVDDLYKTSNMLGYCEWEDTHYRPEEFTIVIDKNQSLVSMLNTIAHEMIHVKQMAKGEFYELISKSKRDKKVYKFNGKTIHKNRMDYLDLPWEVEAVGYSVNVIVQWCKAEGRDMATFLPKELLHD